MSWLTDVPGTEGWTTRILGVLAIWVIAAKSRVASKPGFEYRLWFTACVPCTPRISV